MKLRAFLALDLDEPARQRILGVMAGLKRDLPGVRWVRPEGLHLTLRFLGWTDEETLAAIGELLVPAARACPPAGIRLGQLGMFPEHGAPRVLWIGMDLTEPMYALQRACEEAARRARFEPEERAFRPHLTLGRWKDRARRPELPPLDLGTAEIARLTLYRSDLKPQGAVYTALRDYELGRSTREAMPELLIRSAVLLGAYLLGSVPFSYLVARTRGVDVRRVGSGNVGATNVMRSVSVAAGLLAFGLDAGKGAAAVLLARLIEPSGPLPVLAGVLAVLGHMYPVWLRFQGGKGVATGAGAFLPLAPAATAAALAVFGLALAVTRYVSLSSILGTATLAVLAFLGGSPPVVSRAAAGMAVLIAWKHRANLQRIARGTENRLGRKHAAPPPPEPPA